MNDPYETLGVDKNATKGDIKKAYRKKAQENHPDREGGNKIVFQEISIAYRIIGNDERRKRFDETGSAENKPSIDDTCTSLIASVFDQILSGTLTNLAFAFAAKNHFSTNLADCNSKISKHLKNANHLIK